MTVKTLPTASVKLPHIIYDTYTLSFTAALAIHFSWKHVHLLSMFCVILYTLALAVAKFIFHGKLVL